MPRVKKIIQARDGGPIPVAYSEVEVGGETVLAPVVVLEAGAQVQVSGSSASDAGHQTLTVGDAAVGLPSIPATATGALVTVEDGTIRATWDGTTPTSEIGHKYIDGDAFVIATRADLLRFQAIRRGAVDAVLQVTYV